MRSLDQEFRKFGGTMNTARDYNRAYYLAHPELKEKAKERERQKREEISRLRKSKIPKKVIPATLLAAIAYFVLMSGLTFLLLREMAGFYGESEGSIMLAWLKAGVLEGTVILFSFSTHKKLMHRISYKFLAVGICVLSIYGMCSKQLGLGLGSIESKQINSRAIGDAEKAIAEKSIQRDYLLSHGWITAARKTEAAIDSLRLKLDQLRATAVALKPVQAVTHSTVVQVLLRVFLMLANILAAHKLGELSRKLKSQFEVSGQKSAFSMHSFEIRGRKLKLSKVEGHLQKPRGGGVPESRFDSFWKWFSTGEKVQV